MYLKLQINKVRGILLSLFFLVFYYLHKIIKYILVKKVSYLIYYFLYIVLIFFSTQTSTFTSQTIQHYSYVIIDLQYFYKNLIINITMIYL